MNTSITLQSSHNLSSTGLCERKQVIQDESGLLMRLEEITFHQLGLTWGSYQNSMEKVVAFQPTRPAIISHFRLSNPAGDVAGKVRHQREKKVVVFRETDQPYELCLSPTVGDDRFFFELSVSDDFLASLLTEDSAFLTRFHQHSFEHLPSFAFMASLVPAMALVIQEMQHAPYKGVLKGAFLEAKAIELFLLQVHQFDQEAASKLLRLSRSDIDCLYEVKNHLDLQFDQPCSIFTLSRQVGINQTKLKIGFKELFNTTVFAYLTDARMQAAKRLLLEGEHPISEIADRVGYKHAHHFAAAFKRKFGLSPHEVKGPVRSNISVR